MKTRITLLFALLIVLIIPAAGQVQPLHFMLLTDTQFGMYAGDKEFSRETANYEFTVATVNRLKPQFVVILGDLVNKAGDPEQIREFKRITGRIDQSIPVHYLPGNHDVGHVPTPESVAAYRKAFGRDYYSFQAGPIYAIVLNSTVIHTPKNVQAENQEQNAWLERELQKAQESGLPHKVVFLHHPLFTKDANEPDDHGNIPLVNRKPLLALLHKYGVRNVFAGHVHKSAVARDGGLEMTAIGPVSMPFSEEGSGLSLVAATAEEIRHQFFGFGRLPDRLAIK